MNMDYISQFVAVNIKYDFIDSNDESQVTENWIECRMNIKPLNEGSHCIQVFCYPQSYSQVLPYYVFDININNLKFGPAASRTKEHVYGLFWTYGSKRCKLFFAFDNGESFKDYTDYLKGLLRTLEKHQIEHDVPYLNVRPTALNVSINDNLVGCLNNTETIQKNKETSNKSINKSAARASDASGIYDEIIFPLRPTSSKQLLRPIGLFSGLFGKQSKMNNNGETPTLPPRDPAKALPTNQKTRASKLSRQRKASWNPLKRGRRDERRRSIRLNKSTKSAKKPAPFVFEKTPTDLLNDSKDFNIMDIRTSDLFNNLKSTDEPVRPLQKCNSAPLPTIETFNISSNILWSHNLSLSCISTANMSNVNLMGANVNGEQIANDVYIEDDDNQPHQQSIINSCTKGARRRLQFTIPSIDANGYAVMRPIQCKPHDNKSDEPIYCEIIPSEEENASSKCTQMNEITKNINFERNFDTKLNNFPLLCADTETISISKNDDENTSSGFCSDDDDVSYLTPINQSLSSSRSILIEEGISMSFREFELPSIPMANEIGKSSPNKVEKCVNPSKSNSLKRIKKMELTSTPINDKMDITASLFNIASESKKNVRKCTPFKLKKNNRLEIFGEKLESREMLKSCDNIHIALDEKNLTENSKKMSRSTTALKKCNDKIKNIFVHNIFARDTDKTENVENNTVSEKKLPKLIQKGKSNENNVTKTPASLSKRFIQKCSYFSKKLTSTTILV